jgi:hypothetical protein
MPERTPTVFGAVASGVTLALAIGCRSTPGPDTFKAATVQSTSVETIGAFVQGKLEFDSVLGADSALVDFRQGLIGGKDARRARIEPERRSFRLTAQQAAQGRIIARIRSDDTIPSLGLGPWWTWWWVDSIGTGGWRSVFIPENGKPPYHVAPDPLVVEHHPDYRYKQALARFHVVSIETPKGDPFFVEGWSNACGGCCKQRLPVAPPH